MLLPNNKWELNSGTEGMLVFAQSIVEQLFHSNIDSFKAPALNINSSIAEVNFHVFEYI